MAEREFQLPKPKQDFKGLYAGTSVMLVTMPIDIVKQWSINKTCDCSGKVIRIDSVDKTQSEPLSLPTIALSLEWRPLNALSISIGGYQTRYVLNDGALVFADNNRRARLQEPLKML